MARFSLSRRAVLRGAAGVAIALPWLEAMGPVRVSHAATPAPKRFLAVYTPGGTILERWRPSGEGTSFILSPILRPLAPVQDKLVVLDGLDMRSAIGEQDQAGMVAWLTGTAQRSAGAFAKGPSIDQVLAPRLSASHSTASLNLAVRWGTGKARGRVSPLNIVSFAADETFSPIPPQLDPGQVWQQLFGAMPPGSPGAGGALSWERSMLDAVGRRYAALAKRLGSADRQRLEQHLTHIREMERRLAQAPKALACSRPDPVDTAGYDPLEGLNSAPDGTVRDPDTDAAIPVVGRFMMDMLVMAFACDLTSVGVMQWGDSEAKFTYPWLSLPGNYTQNYYENDGGFHPDALEKIFTWYSGQHAYLIERLQQVDRGGASLLDETVVFFGSHMQAPSTHRKENMPFVLASGADALRPGRYLRAANVSHNDLLVSLLNLFGDDRKTFGDPAYCSGPLPGLLG